MTLTPQQQSFVNAYLGEANGNATKAAIAAGYSERTATQSASRLLRQVHVQEAIQSRLEKHDLKTDAILKRLAKIAYSEPEKVTGSDVVQASKVILQVNGALKDKQGDSRVTVNIGFLQAPDALQPRVIDMSYQHGDTALVMGQPARLAASAESEG